MRLQHYLTQKTEKSKLKSQYAIIDEGAGNEEELFSTGSSVQMLRWLSRHNYVVPTKMNGPQESNYDIELFTIAQLEAAIEELRTLGSQQPNIPTV